MSVKHYIPTQQNGHSVQYIPETKAKQPKIRRSGHPTTIRSDRIFHQNPSTTFWDIQQTVQNPRKSVGFPDPVSGIWPRSVSKVKHRLSAQILSLKSVYNWFCLQVILFAETHTHTNTQTYMDHKHRITSSLSKEMINIAKPTTTYVYSLGTNGS